MPKIKIVDVVDKDVKNDDDYAVTVDEVKENELPDKNEPFEAAEEAPAIVEKKDEAKTEEVSVNTIASEPTKKIREQQLVQCEKCGKFVTPKTLRYTHSLKCGEVEKSRPKKPDIKVNEFVQEEAPPPQPKLVRQTNKVNYEPPAPLSYEDMRRQRIQQRIEQRTVKMQSLFATAI